MNRILQILVLLMMSATVAVANDPENGFGIVKGRVTTADGKAAGSVTVVIKGSKKAAITEDDGTFIIHHVQAGNYDLEISQVGYETTTQHRVVEENKITAVAIQLKLSSRELQEVVVTNSRNKF